MPTQTVALSAKGRVTAPQTPSLTPNERRVWAESYQEAFGRAVRSGVTYGKAAEYARYVARGELRYLREEFYAR